MAKKNKIEKVLPLNNEDVKKSTQIKITKPLVEKGKKSKAIERNDKRITCRMDPPKRTNLFA